jgi:isoamylase
VQRLLAIRSSQPVLRRRTFLSGRRPGAIDVLWLRPDADEMTDADWSNGKHVLGMLLDGNSIMEPDAAGKPIVGDTLLAIFNGSDEPITFTLPNRPPGVVWTRLADTADPDGPNLLRTGGETHQMKDRSVSIWKA